MLTNDGQVENISLTLPLSSEETWGEFLNHVVPHYSPLKNSDNYNLLAMFLSGLKA